MEKKKDNIIHLRPVVAIEEEKQANIKPKNWKKKKIAIMIFGVLLIMSGVIWGYTQLQTHTTIVVVKSYDVSVANSECVSFASGMIRYGKDGAAYINMSGKVIWNQPYQIANPIIETTSKSAVIANRGGNLVVVVDKDGIKGEFETVYPIEKVTISEQGIVGVLTKNESTPEIICYDATGNILVEHKTSVSGTGYPTGIALSPDGQTLLVTYLKVMDGTIKSEYTYYSFMNNEVGSNNVIANGERIGRIIPEVRFINKETSVMISDEGIEIYSDTIEPKLSVEIKIEEKISNVFYGEEEIGVVINGQGVENNKLLVYDIKGDLVLSKEFTGEYRNASIEGSQIFLYEGQSCRIITFSGVEKFVGEMKMELSGVFPVFGINCYIIVGDEGMKEVRLTR